MPKTVSAKNVEEMARWLHEESCRVAAMDSPWENLKASGREMYEDLAKELLTNPPACLVKAIAGKKGTP